MRIRIPAARDLTDTVLKSKVKSAQFDPSFSFRG